MAQVIFSLRLCGKERLIVRNGFQCWNYFCFVLGTNTSRKIKVLVWFPTYVINSYYRKNCN